MRGLIGCSGVIALLAFIIGFVVSLFITDVTWADLLVLAVIPAAMAFVSAFLLFIRDHSRQHSAMRIVRSRLLACDDMSNEQFLSLLPCENTSLLLEIRIAISRFFDVPCLKIHRDLHLVNDLRVDKFEPSFQFCIINSAIAFRDTKPPELFGFRMAGITTIDDLTQSIGKLLDGFQPTDEMDGESES